MIQDNIRVECAFTTAPDDPTPAYQDITQYALVKRGIQINNHGRPDEYGQVQPTTCTVSLNNTDGRFTYGLASSAYYPNVKLRRKLRVSVVVSGTTYYLFTGYVNEWPTAWPSGASYSEVQVTAVDRFARLGQIGAFRSIIEQEYLMDSPLAYYTLGEPSGSVSAGNTSTNAQVGSASIVQLGTGGTLTFGNATGPATDGLTALQLAPVNVTNGKYLNITQGVTGSGASQMLECFFLTSTAATQTMAQLAGQLGVSGGPPMILGIDATGKLTGTGSGSTLTSAGSVADGLTHHAALVQTVSGGNVTTTLYLDGAVAASHAPEFGASFTVTGLRIGGGGGATGTLFTGTLAHVAYYDAAVAPSATRVAAHSASGLTGFSGERSDQRIARYASYAGIPTAEQSLEVGSSTSIAAVDITGQSPLAAMQAVTDTEGGVLFIAGDGKLTFQARSHRYNSASVLTLAGSTDIDQSTQFVTNDALLVNDVTANRSNGITFRATNPTSITDYGTKQPPGNPISLLTTSDNEVVDAANWKANANATPTPRLPGLTVKLAGASPSIQTGVLGLNVGSRVSLGSLPTQAPAASLDQFIEGWSQVWSDQGAVFAFNTSPASSSGVWVLDSATYSQLDVSTRLAY